MNRLKTFNQVGRSMVEILGVLAIIGVLSVGGIAGYSKAMSAYKINKAKSQVAAIIRAYTALKANTSDKSELYNPHIINHYILPHEMLNGDNECHHALGGRCSAGQDAGGNDFFIIRFGDLDRSSCIQLLTMPISSYVNEFSINQVELDTSLSAGYGTSVHGSVSLEQAAELCKENQNSIRWGL